MTEDTKPPPARKQRHFLFQYTAADASGRGMLGAITVSTNAGFPSGADVQAYAGKDDAPTFVVLGWSEFSSQADYDRFSGRGGE